MANSVLAARAGAKQIDGSTRRFGAGAGNTPVEAFAAVSERLGVKHRHRHSSRSSTPPKTSCAPAMPAECQLDRNALIMGYSGVYSSFLKHADTPGASVRRPGAPRCCIEAGQRKLIGGQEDQLIEIAVGLAAKASRANKEASA